MIRLVQTRLIHFRKQYKSLIFWLLLPLFASVIFIAMDTDVDDQLRVPIGVVMKEETPLLKELMDSIDNLPLIEAQYLTHQEAMHQLESHQVDSVFEFPENYDDAILKNKRQGIISHYTSNMSFAAIPVKESIVSFIQEQLNRSKAAIAVNDLFNTYNLPVPSTAEIMNTSKEIQENERLIETTLSYTGNSSTSNETGSFISSFDVWVLSVLFSTLMIFEWVVRERNHPTFIRFGFIAYSSKQYVLSQLSIYLGIFILVDLITFGVLTYGMHKTFTVSILITGIAFRVTTTFGFFLVALVFKQQPSYIMGSIFIFMILVGTSGMFLPIDGLVRRFPIFAELHPLQSVLHGQISYIWLLLTGSLCILWLFKKEDTHVKSS